jgi:hypothetical protein
MKKGTIPNGDDPSRGANRGEKGKLVKEFWCEFSNIGVVEGFSFCLL